MQNQRRCNYKHYPCRVAPSQLCIPAVLRLAGHEPPSTSHLVLSTPNDLRLQPTRIAVGHPSHVDHPPCSGQAAATLALSHETIGPAVLLLMANSGPHAKVAGLWASRRSTYSAANTSPLVCNHCLFLPARGVPFRSYAAPSRYRSISYRSGLVYHAFNVLPTSWTTRLRPFVMIFRELSLEVAPLKPRGSTTQM